MTLAIQHKDNIGCKEELRKAEKLLAKQIEEQPSQIEVDATEADSVASS